MRFPVVGLNARAASWIVRLMLPVAEIIVLHENSFYAEDRRAYRVKLFHDDEGVVTRVHQG